jgi:signal peptidase I
MTKLRRWFVRFLLVLAIGLPLAAIAMYIINPLGANSYDPRQRIIGYGPYRVPARSMAPTLNPDQIVLVRAGYYNNHEPQRGDIVIFINADDGNHWVKRVVGLPGESIAIKAGVVRIDGRELVEEYVAAENARTDYSREMATTKVPQDAYFLLGDNRDNSMDARMLGTTGHEHLVGKVVAILK